MVEITIFLALRHGKRVAAQSLALPTSTVYRWLAEYRLAPAAVEQMDSVRKLEDLIVACEAHGFGVRSKVATLESPKTTPCGFDLCEFPRVADFLSGKKRRPTRMLNSSAALAQAETNAAKNITFYNTPASRRISSSIYERVERARKRIDLRYYSKLSCKNLAQIAGMSRDHFIKTFSAAFGIAPYQYISCVRIQHAKNLLCVTPQPLDAVATAVGFDSLSSLCKSFKSVEGVSLSAFFSGMRLGSTQATSAHRGERFRNGDPVVKRRSQTSGVRFDKHDEVHLSAGANA